MKPYNYNGDYDADGLPIGGSGDRSGTGGGQGGGFLGGSSVDRSPLGAPNEHRTPGTPARNYTIGAILIAICVLSFSFLSGATAVFVGIFGAIAGAVFLIMGVQGSNDAPNLEQHYFDSQPEVDWDDNFKREFGDGR